MSGRRVPAGARARRPLVGARLRACVVVAPLAVVGVVAGACARRPQPPADAPASAAAPAPAGPRVEVKGALHEIMHEGRTGSVATIDARPGSGRYALGPLAGLSGEVVVVDGVVAVSRANADGSTSTELSAPRADVALLVSAEVPAWTRVALPQDVAFDALDETVARLAAQRGVDAGEPFPFLVEGRLLDLSWHVIDGARAQAAGGGHEAHRSASPHGVLDEAHGTLVGFYSRAHRGVFTHHDADVHLHALLSAPPLAAHVDGVRLPAGTVIALPAGAR